MRDFPNHKMDAPKVNREGYVSADLARPFLEWAITSLKAVCDRADLVERGARNELLGPRSPSFEPSSGRRHADDGSVPGPTPTVANMEDAAAKKMEKYASALLLLQQSVTVLDFVSCAFTPMSIERAKALKHSQDGGADCAKCDRWVAQTPSDRLRGGLCFSCYRKSPTAEAG